MSKNSAVKETLQALMQNTRAEPTARITPGDRRRMNRSATVALRLKRTDKETLERHFRERGMISLSAGLRAVIVKYMDENGLSAPTK